MPAGMTLGAFAKFSVAAAFCMGIGSQIVHRKYKPLSDQDAYIEREILTYSPEEQTKIRAAIQVRKDKFDVIFSSLPPEVREKVKNTKSE